MVKVREQNTQRDTGECSEKTLNASRQLSHFFNAYAQAINKSFHRHGKLFETPFKRKRIKNDSYFTQVIGYIHLNPEKHGFVHDFRDWEFSSWHSLSSGEDSFLVRQEVYEWFGSKEQFVDYHLQQKTTLTGL